MLYFVKGLLLHRYPVPARCGVAYEREQLRDTIPLDAQECVYCMRRWPGDKE